MTPPPIVDRVVRLFERCGADAYFGELVTQQAHALQCASLAQTEGAGDGLIVAALLHDVGHLLHGLPEDIADYGTDARHEEAGYEWLAQFFGPDVSEPVRLHVEAKRYLCAVDPEYVQSLSTASRQSLALQGGPFSAPEVQAFVSRPFAKEAISLRRWDDRAKTPGLDVPPLDCYLRLIEATSRRTSAGVRHD